MKVFAQFDKELQKLWPETPMPFYTFAWHKAWFEHFGKSEHLAIISHDGGIVPLAFYEDVAHFTGGEEIADYLDAIGSVEWTNVLSMLRERGATELLLRNVPEGSLTLSQFPHEREDTTPTLTLPQSFDTYLASLDRKKRHELRRKMRRFEEEHKDISIEEHEDIELLLTLMQNNDEKRAFLTPAMQDFFRTLPTIASVKQFVLTVNGAPVATTLAFEVDHSLLLYNSGFSVEGSGWYLKAKLIEWAITNNYTSVNFLQGGERYKYDFGALDSFVYRVRQTL